MLSYGFGENEALVGAAVAPFRDKVTTATKVGVVRSRKTPNIISINGTSDYIKQQCATSLKRLGVSTIDLYYLHHVDPNTPIEETISAMAQLVEEGKVRYLGLGEMSTENVRRAHKIHPITAIQAEYSLFSKEAEKGIIPLCRELGIGLVPCAPVCRGLLGGSITSFDDLASDDFRRMLPRFEPENFAHNFEIVSALKMVAQHKSCSLSQLAPHGFVNEYAWGSFKGDENLWMEKYFDAFLYYANWGTHILKLKVPSSLLNLQTAQSYCNGETVSARLHNENVILSFLSTIEDGGVWEEGLRLSSFLSLRTELSRGDLRCLYLGWLSHIQNGECDKEELEPPVPPGLAELSPALVNLAEFLRIDSGLITAASTKSLSLEIIRPSPSDLGTWLSTLPANEKENLLATILEGGVNGDQVAATRLCNRFTREWCHQHSNTGKPGQQRTVAELLKESTHHNQKQRRKRTARIEDQ